MAEPYFTGDNVPLKFKITDALGDVEPSAVSVIIYKAKSRTATDGDDAEIDGNTVSYLVPVSVTSEESTYRAFFICTLPSGIRTYMMSFNVRENPR